MIKRLFFTFFVLVVAMSSVQAQKYATRSGQVYFKSNGTIDDGVEATNEQVGVVLDASTGAVAFQVLIKSFRFEKALMEEHFNENYLESDEFPKSIFKGSINDYDSSQLEADGEYEVTIAGELTLHGITQKVNQPGSLVKKGDQVMMKTHMMIALADYGIEIPSVVREKIAEVIDVDIDVTLDLVK